MSIMQSLHVTLTGQTEDGKPITIVGTLQVNDLTQQKYVQAQPTAPPPNPNDPQPAPKEGGWAWDPQMGWGFFARPPRP